MQQFVTVRVDRPKLWQTWRVQRWLDWARHKTVRVPVEYSEVTVDAESSAVFHKNALVIIGETKLE